MNKIFLTIVFSFCLFVFTGYSQDITLTKSFEGTQWNAKLPPDPGMAVGPNHIVLTINNGITICDKNGNIISQYTLLNWFSTVSPPGDPFDPKVVYDHLSNRWIVFALSGSSSPSNYLISVSQSSDPTGGWYCKKFDAANDNSRYHADFTGLGYDQEAIYITSNQVDNYSSLATYPKVRAINKNDLYNDAANPAFHDFTGMRNADGNYALNIKPVHQFGTSSEYYLMNSANDITANYVTVWAITDPFGSNPTITRKATINVGNYNPPGTGSNPGDAVQENSSVKIDLDDARISDCIFNNGFLYGCFAVKNSTNDGSAIKYFKINTSGFFLAFNDVIEQSSVWYYYPEIYPDAFGNILITFNKSSSNDFAGFAYTYRKAEQSTIGPISWLKQGEGIYNNLLNNRNRWGDFNGICLDPSQDNQIWMYGEYAKSNNTWGTWVGAVQFSLSTIPVTFTNEIGNQNAGGSLAVSGYGNVNSGNSLPLQQGNYTASTNNERFSNWNNSGIAYKQNNWNDANSEYFLSHNFISTFGPDQNQNANFNSLNYAKVQVLIDGSLISNLGTMQFQDPWYVQSNGSQEGTNYWIPVTSYYEPSGNANASDKGVFLNKGDTLNMQPPYYSVQAPLTQTITVNGNSYSGVFQSWNPSGATLVQVGSNPTGYDQKAVVFNSAGATVTANYKGIHLSNTSTTWVNNSQRKVVRTPNNWLHMVYESLGHVWWEASSDNGTTWQLMNGGQYLDNGGGKSPSIAEYGTSYNGYQIAIVYQEGTNIQLKSYSYIGSSPYVNGPAMTIPSGEPYTTNINPNIAWGSNYIFMVTWESKTGTPGISYATGYLNGLDNWNLCYTFGHINGTDGNSITAAISTNQLWPATNFDVAWEQYVSPTSYSIEYCNLAYSSCSSVTQDPVVPMTVSISSLSRNSYPTIVTYSGGTRIAWIAAQPPFQRYFYLCDPWNSQYWHYQESYYRSPSLNKLDDGSAFYLAWSWGETSPGLLQFVSSNDLSTVHNFNILGGDIQLANADVSTNMYATAYSPYSLPYYFQQTNSVGSIPKISPNSLSVSRGCILANANTDFLYSFGDITVDNNSVDFVKTENKTKYNNMDTVNAALTTEPFYIKDNSEIQFGEYFNAADSALAVSALGDSGYVDYKIELVDNASGRTLGTIRDFNPDLSLGIFL